MPENLNINDLNKALLILLRILINKKTKHKIFKIIGTFPNSKAKITITQLTLKIVLEINRLNNSKIKCFLQQSKNKDSNQISIFKIENKDYKINK